MGFGFLGGLFIGWVFFLTEDCRLCKASAPATFRQPSCPGMANGRQKRPQQSPGTAEFRNQKVGFLKQTYVA